MAHQSPLLKTSFRIFAVSKAIFIRLLTYNFDFMSFNRYIISHIKLYGWPCSLHITAGHCNPTRSPFTPLRLMPVPFAAASGLILLNKCFYCWVFFFLLWDYYVTLIHLLKVANEIPFRTSPNSEAYGPVSTAGFRRWRAFIETSFIYIPAWLISLSECHCSFI